jgi:hypothetical protein
MPTRASSFACPAPVSGDSLCIAPLLMTPEATLDRLGRILGEASQAAT